MGHPIAVRQECLSTTRLSHWCFWWKLSRDPVPAGVRQRVTYSGRMPPSQGQDGGRLAARENVGESWGSDPSVLSTQRFVCGENTTQTRRACVPSLLSNWTRDSTPLSPCFLLCDVRTIIRPLPPGDDAETAPGIVATPASFQGSEV